MRHLINLFNPPSLTPITESIGLANRKPGETFVNDAGDMITFMGLTFFPQDGNYETGSEVDTQIQQIEKSKSTKIKFTNERNAGTLAVGVATFKDSNNNIIMFGRYFRTISHIFQKNNFPNNAIPGFKYSSKAAVKMSSGVMPQDVLTKMDNLTTTDILNQVVKKFGPKHPLTSLTNAIAKGQSLPIYVDFAENPDLTLEAVRDYFCEILQPMAIVNGLTVGSAADAEKAFFGKGGFKTAKISFDNGKNTGLFDSLLTNDKGRVIKISTKGKGGAMASTRNISDAVSDLKQAGKTEMLAEYADVIDIVDTVKKGGYIDGPLNLAVKFSMISPKEADIVRSMNKSRTSPKLTANLQKMYDARAANADQTKLVPFYNMLAAIAYRVADYVNENTNFNEAVADILNNAALIQVNTTASMRGTQFILESLVATYPSKAVTTVYFSAMKTYFSSGNKGNFTFKIVADKTTDDKSLDSAPAQTQLTMKNDTMKKVANVANAHVSVRPPGADEVDRERVISPPRTRR